MSCSVYCHLYVKNDLISLALVSQDILLVIYITVNCVIDLCDCITDDIFITGFVLI